MSKKKNCCMFGVVFFIITVSLLLIFHLNRQREKEGLASIADATPESVKGYSPGMEKQSWGIVTNELADANKITPPQAYCQLAGSQGLAIKKMSCQSLNEYNCKNTECCTFDKTTGKCNAIN